MTAATVLEAWEKCDLTDTVSSSSPMEAIWKGVESKIKTCIVFIFNIRKLTPSRSSFLSAQSSVGQL